MSLDSSWFRSNFLKVFKFPKIKEMGPNFLGVSISAEPLNYLVPHHLHFNFRSFKGLNSPSFIRFHCVLHHSRLLFSESWSFYKLKRGDLISWGEQFFRMAQLFGLLFCISILKVLKTQIVGCSFDLNVFFIIQEYFSQSLEDFTN